MRDRVRRFIAENGLLRTGDRVTVALSGGADSVCLLHILISLKKDLNLTVSAAHFNHSIRGAEADRDEIFVARLCEQWDVPLFLDRADVPAAAAESGESVELCGRRLRYAFFDSLVESGGTDKIATAHHRDDNAETILLNLTRGTGIAGLGGIPARRGEVIRPLLCCSREEIEGWCREHALAYVTDSTNLQPIYTRNRLRFQVMPVLRELNPAVDEGMERTAGLMREAEDFLNKISTEELKKAERPYGYSCERLLSLDPILQKYAVKKVLENTGAEVDFRHVALIIEAMRSGGSVMLSPALTVSCAQGLLRAVSSAEPVGFCIPFSEYLGAHAVRIPVRGGKPDFSGTKYAADGADVKKINNLLFTRCIRCDIISDNTVYRSRRAGDTFTDARRGVTKPLKKLMNELKIPRELRDSIPLVADGSTVLWMQGRGASAQAKPDLSRDREIIIMGEK